MKVCIVVEGAYPYVNGGVSSWLQQLLLSMPDVEFVIQVITAGKDGAKEFKYKIPNNVSEIQEIYLMDDDVVEAGAGAKIRLSRQEYEAFESLMFGEQINWQVLFDFFHNNLISLNGLFGGADFLKMTTDYYNAHFNRAVFSDFLWTMRSMYLPLFSVMKASLVEADLYHPISTGYAGVIASMEKAVFHKKMMLTEHGIYTREREEELIKADWVRNIYKELWIGQFRKLSLCCYEHADIVTSLFQEAREFQAELGCDRSKTRVIPNGVNLEGFQGLPQKKPGDDYLNLGAVVRVTPIKDIKTMINAFGIAKRNDRRLKLWIMGPLEESEQYAAECMQLVEELEIPDVVFTGTVNVKEYLGKMDVLLLSSISEGQPLAILEAFAAKKPVIATNVGNCKGLLLGEMDEFGRAGYVVPVMNAEKMALAMLEMAEDEELRIRMGETGYRRVCAHYRSEVCYGSYLEAYRELFPVADEEPKEALKDQNCPVTEEDGQPDLVREEEAESGSREEMSGEEDWKEWPDREEMSGEEDWKEWPDREEMREEEDWKEWPDREEMSGEEDWKERPDREEMREEEDWKEWLDPEEASKKEDWKTWTDKGASDDGEDWKSWLA